MFIFVALFYVCLRLWNLTASCLWFDEIFSVHAAEHDWLSLLQFVAQDLIHPPLFYVLLKIWIIVGGESLFWLRFFSIFFSIVALVPFYLLCRQLKLKNSIITLAAIFLAANGALIKYAQEVRMYSLLLCASLFSMWLFARYFNFGKNYKILILINIILVYTHYFGWLVVLPQIFVIAVLQNIKIRQMLIMLGAAIVSYVPWIYLIWQSALTNSNGLAQNIGWMTRPTPGVIFHFVFDLIEPFYYQQSSDEPASRFIITIPFLLIIGWAKILYLSDWQNESEKNAFYLLSAFVGLPLLLVLIVSWISPYSIWGTRHLIIIFVPALILAAKFLIEIRSSTVRKTLLSLVAVLFAAALFLQIINPPQKFIWCAYDNLAQNIDVNQPQKVYAFEDLTAYHLWFALRDKENAQVIKVNGLAGIEEDKSYFLPRGFDKVKQTDEKGIEGEKIWLVFKAKEWNETAPPLKNLIDKGYQFSQPQIVEAQGLKAILVEAKKGN